MTVPRPACRYQLSSPPAGGAIGIITLSGDIDAALVLLGIRRVPLLHAALRDWPNVDSIVLARPSPTAAILFPHAGQAVLHRAINALRDAGIGLAADISPEDQYPEARSPLEARMLAALARAESPLSIDLLLDQPRRWLAAESDPALRLPDDASRRLNRLIDPPLVVALGPPNIGKSSLLNALAGRSVSIVADIPGTTRDHVGVALELAGLIVRYIDTPGIGALPGPHAPIDDQAQQIALRIAASADLLLLCADSRTDYLPAPTGPAEVLRVALRSDLGLPTHGSDVAVSVRNNTGLDVLTQTLRDRLIPPDLVADRRAWSFWLPSTPPRADPYH